MKQIWILLWATQSCLFGEAQLQHSTWKATIHGDNPRNVLLEFRKDTVFLLAIYDSAVQETMTYIQKDSTLILHKISGMSDCDNQSSGKYKFIIERELMTIRLLEDPCEDRSSALDNTRWQKWKVRPEAHVDQSVLKKYVGEYEFDAGHHILISLENGRLQAEGPSNNLPKSALYAISNTRFFLKVAGVDLEFIADKDGKVVKMISHEEADHELRKVK
jgi:hypothetical protein